jgi:very-short-patch-repair endonuclease
MKYDTNIVLKWFWEHKLAPVTEWQFDTKRKWRFDFAWPEVRVALEVEGGVFTNGRHTRASGFIKDMEKYNRAAVLGWRVLRTTPDNLCMQETIDMVKSAWANARKHYK